MLKWRHPLTAADVVPPASTWSGPTIKVALWLGFGLIGSIWLLAGYYFTARMADLERRSTDINARYMRAQELLTTARGQVLLGSVYVRDALLDPDPATAATYRAQLEDSYRAADDALGRYEPVVDGPAERARIERLRTDIDDFRKTLLDVLATDSGQWPTEARAMLRSRIMPKREGVIRVSEEVQAINRTAFVQQQRDIASVYRVTQRHVWQSFGLAVIASLGIALLAIAYTTRLEERIRRQRVRDAENTRDLQRLSAQLLTAQEQERRSIARELHDEVGQVLTAIKLELSLAEHAVEASGGPPALLGEARAITDGAIHAVRDLSHLLHPAMLDDLGLAAATEWYLKGFSKRHGIRADLLYDPGQERLAPATESAAYRIVQEALTNVARHARATSCRVYLQRLTHTMLVTIEDDGCGFDTTAAAAPDAERGLGLISIRERASQLRGTLRIESRPGNGTRVTVELPAWTRDAVEDDDERSAAASPAAVAGEVLDG